MIQGKRIFITGGAGFIGSSLAISLLEQNRVVVFDTLERDNLSWKPEATHPNLTLVQGDILDTDSLGRAIRGCDIVVHAAAVAGIFNCDLSPVKTFKVNGTGTANVLDTALSLKNLEKFIYFSTSEVCGSRDFQIRETDSTVIEAPGKRRWVYSASKLAGEHLAYSYFEEYNMPVVTVRPFNTYGPGQIGESAIHVFIRKALENQDLHIFGTGSQLRTWCYITDMVNALHRILNSDNCHGEIFNIGSAGEALSTKELAQRVIRLLDSTSRIVHKDPLPADIERRIPSIEKAESLLGFQPTVTLEDGIVRTAGWYREHSGVLPELASIF